MPLFEYRCSACGTKFDELVGHADEAVACPKCHSPQTEKLLSVFAAATAGTGSLPSCARPGCGAGGFS